MSRRPSASQQRRDSERVASAPDESVVERLLNGVEDNHPPNGLRVTVTAKRPAAPPRSA